MYRNCFHVSTVRSLNDSNILVGDDAVLYMKTEISHTVSCKSGMCCFVSYEEIFKMSLSSSVSNPPVKLSEVAPKFCLYWWLKPPHYFLLWKFMECDLHQVIQVKIEKWYQKLRNGFWLNRIVNSFIKWAPCFVFHANFWPKGRIYLNELMMGLFTFPVVM